MASTPAKIGAFLGGGFVVLLITILPPPLLPFPHDSTLLVMGVAAMMGAAVLGALAFVTRTTLDRGAREMSFVGTRGVQRVVRGVSEIVLFENVARLDVQQTDLKLRGTTAVAQETTTLAWRDKNGGVRVMHCEFQPALARGSAGLDHDRFAFGEAARRAWAAFAATRAA